MRKTLVLALTLIIGMAFANVSFAAQTWRAKGGGVSTQSGFEKIRFTAEATTSSGSCRPANGEIEVKDDDGDPTWHGTVTHIALSGDLATLVGVLDPNSADASDPFTIYVRDRGEGVSASPDEVEFLVDLFDCETEDPDYQLVDGNLQVKP